MKTGQLKTWDIGPEITLLHVQKTILTLADLQNTQPNLRISPKM